MSNQGVRGYYQITKTLRDTLLDDVNVNTVTTGDISDVDLSKQTIFPLAHIIVNSAQFNTNHWRLSVSVLCMDIVDVSKEETTDIFTGNTNEQDVLNTQLAVLNLLLSKLSRGTLYTDKYQVDGTPSCEPFVDRFEHLLTGWSCTFDVLIQNDIDICD
jgi:hypothetical protein|tara:strand:- start:16467 stop:16940 length:474 start_codon:yes stop_codon:yes gene_type:complete